MSKILTQIQTKDEKISEDIVHNSFIKISNKLNEIDNITELKRYMTVVAKNEAYDYYNYNKKIYKSDKIDELNKTDDNFNPEKHTIKSETMGLVNSHIQKLTPKNKSIIYFRISENKSFKEIAKHFQKKETTLRSNYSRAVKQIRDKLFKAGDLND
ncbi:RNA polymerase sigma factor [Natranaerobius trueperi]|uniref:RNA polymerase sigma factor n=1 Tax=Natranaerobius trueperi TaxID=759412 RepID=UPI001303293A|nr:sigma-70 family RNA polymerase sigma factor [Natranaerobius trueperi]